MREADMVKVIYDAMPVTRPQTVNTVGPSGTGMASTALMMMPIAWDDLTPGERRPYLKAASDIAATLAYEYGVPYEPVVTA